MLNNSPEQIEWVRSQIEDELARRSYYNYISYVHHGMYEHFRHTELICESLQPIAEGESKRIMIFLPPRHSKSMTVTESFPSYFIGRNPNKRVITTAYGDSLARKFGRMNKQKVQEFGYHLFDVDMSRENASNNNWSLEGYRGGMISTGIGGAITGEGADCFPAGTMIETEIGVIDISDLVEMKKPPRVLSFDHKTSTLAYKKILARRRKQANEFTRVTTASGNQVISTRDHRFYTHQRGYWEASLLRCGDRLTTNGIKKKHALQGVWSGKERKRIFLQALLSGIKKINSNLGMYPLPQAFRETALRIYERCQKGTEGFLLFKGLFPITSCGKEYETMSDVWRSETYRKQILREMCGGRKKAAENVICERLSKLWDTVSTYLPFNSILFEGLCQSISFKENERGEQSSLQRWKKLQQMVRRNAVDCFRKRQSHVHGLWNSGKLYGCSMEWTTGKEKHLANSSYRRGFSEQQSGESDYFVPTMSYHPSQIGSDTVSRVENISGETVPVYDIQVEGTSNFFANGILVHNCLIIDDPFKNREEANSKTIRDKVWDEWQNTLLTRLHKGASVILIMTRWHEDDLAGRLLSDEGADDWEIISLPAIAEGETDLLDRVKGEPLCPELGFDEEWAEQKQRDVGSLVWAALYQQRPSPAGGGIFKRSHFRYFIEKDGFFILIDEYGNRQQWRAESCRWFQTIDTAMKKTQGSDYTAIGTFCLTPDKNLLIYDIYRDRIEVPDQWPLIKQYRQKWSRIAYQAVEDKASGIGLIQQARREGKPLKVLKADVDKVTRAFHISVMYENGMVYHKQNASWLDKMEEELLQFPNGAHDDMVDVCSYAGIESSKEEVQIFV